MNNKWSNKNGWTETKLGDITEKIGDGLHGTPKFSEYGKYLFVNGNNLRDGKILIKNDTKKVTKDEFEKYRKDLNKNTILLSINGTIGNLAKYRNEKCILGKSAAFINVSNEAHLNFIYYLMLDKKFQFNISKNANGSTIKNVSLEQLRNYKFLLPPLCEQKAIAAVLTSFDDKIELLRQQNQTLEEMAQTLFKEWFVDFRFPGVGKMVDSELGMIPEGWKVGNLEELLEIKYGKDHKHLGEGDIPVYGSGGIMRYANKALYSDQSILIPRKGTLSNLFYINKPFWTVDTMFYSKIRKREFGIFSFLLLKTMNLASMDVGSAVPSLTTKLLNELKVVIPDNKVMKVFNDLVSVIFEKKEFNTYQIQTLTKLRDSLLPKLMSGEVRVNDF